MKIRSLLSVVLVVACSGLVFSQSVKITPKKTVFRRPKPEASYKKTFTITYPRISGLSPSLNKKIESTISYEKTVGLKLNEELGEFQWLEEASYEVTYNKKGILVIALNMEGSAAYPSNVNKTVVVDLKAGNLVTPQQAFTNLAGLAALCKKAQEAEVKAAIAQKKGDPEDEVSPDMFENTNFKVADLKEFSISDQGVTFLYDYGFPHVVLALQPDGQYFFTWRQMKPFIKQGGLLHQFVR